MDKTELTIIVFSGHMAKLFHFCITYLPPSINLLYLVQIKLFPQLRIYTKTGVNAKLSIWNLKRKVFK